MYRYLAYGLGIHSQLQLFDLPIYDVDMDVVIQIAEVDASIVDADAPHPYLLLNPEEAILSIDRVGRIKVRNGNHIIVDPHPEADNWLMQRYIVGAGMALLLYQRKRLVLHASAVNLDGRGIAFLGASGTGKSSLAAAFLAHGHQLLVDDVTATDIEKDAAWITPGFPYIKLNDETPEMIALGQDKLEFIDHLEDKASFRIVAQPSSERIPLKCIYVIVPGEKVEFQQYDFRQSLIELVRYSIPPSMVKLDKAYHFDRCMELVNLVPVYGLRRPVVSLPHLAELANHIEDHAMSFDAANIG